jgi:SAM-dependent methyltransferase
LLKSSDILAFWETAHKRNAHLWLTGSDPGEVLRRLDVGDLVRNCREDKGTARVLDVGVGEGRMARFLSELGVRHDALDISTAAVENIANFCDQGYVSPADLPSDRYDLIMHHLVAQHMSHESLKTQLDMLIRALRVDGLIAVQYSAAASLELAALDDEENQKMGSVIRNPEWFSRTAPQVGAQVLSDDETDSFGDIRFRVVKLGRDERERGNDDGDNEFLAR